MKELILSSGQAVAVDDDVYEWASQEQWRPGGFKGRYAMRFVKDGKSVRTVYLHKAILSVAVNLTVDHIDGNTWDCRRQNLRPATYGQNQQNRRGAQPGSRTGFRNVWYDVSPRRTKRYRVALQVDGRRITVGAYTTAHEANVAAVAARARLMTHAPESPEGAS